MSLDIHPVAEKMRGVKDDYTLSQSHIHTSGTSLFHVGDIGVSPRGFAVGFVKGVKDLI